MLEVLNTAQWTAGFSGSMDQMSESGFWVGVVQIIWIDILLAGDNAVVIALACRGLPERLRTWGMVLGAGAAIVLRILATLVIATLMSVPFLKIAGGLALFYIAVKLLLPEEEDSAENRIASSDKLWQAVRIIVLADIVMSLDNVIAIAAASKGHVLLFAFGLAVSIPLIVAGARVVMELLHRFPALIWAGGALLGWIAGQVIATDPVIRDFLLHRYGHEVGYAVEIAMALLGVVIVISTAWKLRNCGPKPV